MAPIFLIIDNETVMLQFAALTASKGRAVPKDDCNGCWTDIAEIVSESPRGHYNCAWVPSHLLEPGKEERDDL